jgi:dTDP-4-amino-4,6-dideoxygalactose transaminase
MRGTVLDVSTRTCATGRRRAWTPARGVPRTQGPDPRPALPVSERLAERILSLPLFPGLTAGEIDRVAAALGDALR